MVWRIQKTSSKQFILVKEAFKKVILEAKFLLETSSNQEKSRQLAIWNFTPLLF